MVSPQAALRESLESHIHVLGDTCPVCDQPIPNDKAEAVRARMEARERVLADAARAEAAQQIAAEKARIEAAARAAGKNEADAALRGKLAAAEQAKALSEATSQERIAA